ncbi:radical SAM protein [Bifidobacterium mongoliense]|uniref:radical SAM protein n=1 Tax=Bifidobacterium mongoliense TaxID=518643 RepID=UPI0030F3FF7B
MKHDGNIDDVGRLLMSIYAHFNHQRITEDTDSCLPVAYHPGFACNLSCEYCYQYVQSESTGQWIKPTSKGSHSVPKNDLSQFIVDRMHQLRKTSVALSFLGGEPLLYLQDIKDTVAAIRNVTSISETHFITNGVLIDNRVIDVLHTMENPSVQITLDGGRNSHDHYRHLANGLGTYDRLLTTIGVLIDSGVSLHVRINATSKGIGEIPGALRDLASYAIAPNMSIDIALIDDTDKFHDSNMNHEIIDEYEHLYFISGYLGFKISPPWMRDGCATCQRQINGLPHGIVLTSSGDLYSCWDSAGQSNMSMGNIHTGYHKGCFERTWVQCGYMSSIPRSQFKQLRIHCLCAAADGRVMAEQRSSRAEQLMNN